uniref:Uncharacterized protein n=1 Tax=Arundo donax TaxID=35708 RepID=A0A0A9AIB9_ARUDO
MPVVFCSTEFKKPWHSNPIRFLFLCPKPITNKGGLK